MNFLKKCGEIGLLFLAMLLLSVPALADGFTEDGAPQDWTEAEEINQAEDYETARATLLQLDTPTELEWCVDYHRFHGQEAEKGEIPEGGWKTPGMFSWRLGTLRQYHYKVCIYRKADSGDVLVDVTERWYGGDRQGNAVLADGNRRASCFRFLLEDYDSGDYYFTVQALGDGVRYESSNTARSEIWHYEQNADRLETPGRPAYENSKNRFFWTASGGDNLAQSSYVKYFYAPDQDSQPEVGGGMIINFLYNSEDGKQSESIVDRELEEHGSGWYSIQARTISRDLERMNSSAWSEISEPVYMESKSGTLEGLLNGLTENSSDQEKQAAVEAVRQMDAYALSQLMAADQENTGAAGCIARLEELAGTQATIDVSETMQEALNPDEISVTGAGLNVDVGQSVSLKVGEPDPDAIIPTMYGNTLQFSMGLESGAGEDVSRMLRVPVKITLPLPGYINPDYLVILHRHANGSYEEVFEPWVREENGQWLATFVVRSFSTFALAERRLSASQIPTGAEVSFIPEARDGAETCFFALYDKKGKLLGIQEASLNGGRQMVSFACETSAPECGKVLYLDDGFCPVGETEDFTVTKG